MLRLESKQRLRWLRETSAALRTGISGHVRQGSSQKNVGRSVFHIARLPQRRPNAVILLFPVRAQKLSFLVSNLVPKRIKRAGLLSMYSVSPAFKVA